MAVTKNLNVFPTGKQTIVRAPSQKVLNFNKARIKDLKLQKSKNPDGIIADIKVAGLQDFTFFKAIIPNLYTGHSAEYFVSNDGRFFSLFDEVNSRGFANFRSKVLAAINEETAKRFYK